MCTKSFTLRPRNIMKIKTYFTKYTAFKCIVHLSVTSRLNSNNPLLYNAPLVICKSYGKCKVKMRGKSTILAAHYDTNPI